MRKIFLLITSLFLLTFLGTIASAQKAILQTDCGKIECEEKGPHFNDKYSPGNWTDEGAECICQYYTLGDWELTYCALGTGPPTEEELQTWRDCGVPVPGGPSSGSWGWTGKEEGSETIEPADLTQLTFVDHAADPDWNFDGSQIAFHNFIANRIGIINADGTGLRYLDIGGDPNWSPVENKLAVVAWKKEQNLPGHLPGPSLYLVDLDTGDITFLVRWANAACWSPDGTKIAYALEEEGLSSIWAINPDGSGKTRLTFEEDGYCTGLSFSYDGSKIVYLKGFTSYAVGGPEEEPEPNEIWVMDVNGSNKHMIYASGDSTQLIFQRAWNKNNKILFMRTWYRVKPPQVWIINADGSDPKPVVASSDVFGDPVWDSTGTKVAIHRITPPSLLLGGNIWTFSYQELAEEEEVIEEPEEEVEEAPKNIFQKIWEKILNFFKWIFRLIPHCPKSCDDGNPCTKDFCSSETDYQCEHSPIFGTTEGCQDLVETCKQYQCLEWECQIVTLANCCGNRKCEVGEDWETCPQDCEMCDDGNPCTQDIYSYETGKCSYIKLTGVQPSCSAKVTCGSWACRTGVCQIEYISNCCGNKVCEVGETYATCPADCPNCDDDNKCTKDSYDYHQHKCVNAPILDVICCGNGVCETEETYENCPKDCPNFDDNNKCTEDSYDYHGQKCINEPIIPCCGNRICDEGVEEYLNCPTDCPNCDDNNRLTADSFSYETQKCENIVTHYFIDDFEEGVQNWDFFTAGGKPTTTAWTTTVEDGNTVLKGTGHNWADLWGKEWDNYIFKFRFKMIKGNWLHANFRNNFVEGGLNRYFVSVSEGEWIDLQRQLSPSVSSQVLKSVYFIFDKNWHTLEIWGYGNILNIYIDDELLIKYKDTENPVLSGGVAFETSGKSKYLSDCPESEFLVDDVEIKVITEEDIIYP